jgi:hypothetical protein
VPAVVGTATIGKMPLGSARVHQSPISSKSHIGRVWPAMKAMTLPVSSPEPPPKAMTPSCPPARSTAMPASTLVETGFGFTSENTRDRNAGVLQQRQHLLRHRQCGEPGIGDQQRPAMPATLSASGKFVDAAGAEADGGGVVPVGFGRHQTFLR